MANVLLTTQCNLNCTYCFAQERMQDKRNQVMSMGDVGKVIAFLKRSEHLIFRAMGGEPTLHPQFPQIVQLALQEGMRVDLLSNATWPESHNRFFDRISPSRLFFLLNIDHPDSYPPKLWARIEHNLAAVAPRGDVTLSFNIFETQPRYEYVLDLASRYRIDKVRMSFSLPVVGAQNAYLKWEDYKRMPPFIIDLVRRAEAIGVEVRLDNAVPLCIFDYEQAGELLMKGVLDFRHNARCEPIIDIGPDLTVWCCFCLSKLWNRHLDEFETLQQAQAYYRQAMAAYQDRLFPMDECRECRYRERWGCQGGCLTHTIMRYGEPAVKESPAQAEGNGWQPGAILALAENVLMQHFDIPDESYIVYDQGSGLEIEVDKSFQPLLALLDGQHSAEQIVEHYVASNQSQEVEGLVAAFASKALREGANDLLLGLRHQGFLVERAG